VGRVPLNYLAASLEEKARILFANAQGILRQFSTKQDFKVRHALRYVPFRQLPDEPTAPLSVESRLSKIESLLDEGSFDVALSSADDLIDVALKGIRYIHGCVFNDHIATADTGPGTIGSSSRL
jgi:phosphatidylinositol glycan class N